MTSPTLDFRDAEQFYAQTLALAKAYVPEWSDYWNTLPPSASDVDQDPGLVLLKLFSQLAAYTADIENAMPEQRRLGFFQFMNMQLRAPLAAQAPLRFLLKAGQPAATVPAQCAVLDGQDQTIRFQTNETLLVLPATLSAALTLIPAQDQFIDALPGLLGDQAGVPIFVASQQADPAEQPLGHWFMMGDPALFKPDDALQSITVSLTGKQLYPEYFGQWFDGALTPLTTQLTSSSSERQLDIVLGMTPRAAAVPLAQLQRQLYRAGEPGAGFDAAPLSGQDEEAQYWLLVKPAPQVKVLASLAQQLPVITGLTCTFKGKAIVPQQAACNGVLLDIANGAYPFGETPKTNAAFYLRSDSVFARTGALVTIHFTLATLQHTFAVRLVWQFWDGVQWSAFNATTTDASTYQFVDRINNFQYDNPDGATCIQFACPKFGPGTVAGSEGLWLRCVIAEGGYGQQGGIASTSVSATIDAIPAEVLDQAQKLGVSKYLNDVAGVNFSYTISQPSYYPPFVLSARIEYSFAAKPQSFWSYNAFTLSRFLFSPFKPVDALLTGFYFAFDDAGFAAACVGNKLVLYFYLQQEQAAPGRTLQWEYHDGQQWQALAVDDATYGLSRSGLVGFVVPAAMQAAYLFSQTAFWFRINNAHVDRTIRLYGMYPNTVMASNLTTLVDEVLGSSNEQMFQQFTLDYPPVLADVLVCVIEPAGLMAGREPGAAELADAALAEVRVGAGEVARRWTQVENFAFSGPTDRVYMLDYANGLLTFGDGYNGMIPPPGHNNIVAMRYHHTQGLAGNVGAGALTVLRPGIANIAAVANPAPAAGGVGCATRAELAATSPALVRAGGWAVQLQDFTALAGAASAQVAQARAVEAEGNTIRIAVLPLSTDPLPYASPALLDQVGVYVRQYCLAALVGRIGIEAARYVPVSVTAQLAARIAPDQIQAEQARIAALLRAYFQPVYGGPPGQGWRFGQTVQASAIHVLLRSLPGVSAVLGLNVNGRQDGNVVLAPTELPVAGGMLVYISAV